MPTSVPAVIAFGDVEQVVLVDHSSTIYAVCLKAGGVISLHRDGDDPEVFTDLPFGASKDKIGAAVVGDLLHLVWGHGANVVHARWDIPQKVVDKAPVGEFVGTRPALTIGQGNTKLLCHYINAAGNHESRTSSNGGDNWDAAVVIDTVLTTEIEDVDVNISALSDAEATWANVKGGSGPGHLWTFDEISGTLAADSYGNADAEYLTGAIDTTMKVGKAHDRNTGGSIRIGEGGGATVPIDAFSNVTIQFWVDPVFFINQFGWGAIEHLFSFHSFANGGTRSRMAFYHYNSAGTGQVWLNLTDAAGNSLGGLIMNDNYNSVSMWTVTVDGTDVRVYKNAGQVSSTTLTGPLPSETRKGRILDGAGGSAPMNGRVDHFKIFPNYAMGPAEVAANYAAENAGSSLW
jgi:hypothetical protein